MKAKPGAKTQAKALEPKTPKFQVPFTRKNYLAFGVGLALLLLGYIFMAQPPADGFLSRTLSPILLVLSYCVVFPYAIMARVKPKVAPPATKAD